MGVSLATGQNGSVEAMTNPRVLKRSRPKLQAGEVFALSPATERWLFGRVILADLPSGRAPMPLLADLISDALGIPGAPD
jgi:hypothetical protein